MEVGELYLSTGDLVVSALLLLYFASGFINGLIKTGISLLRVLLLAVTLTLFADMVSDEVARLGNMPPLLAYVFAVLAVSAGSWFVLWLITLILKRPIFEMSTMMLDRIVGAALGLMRGFVTLMVLIGLLSYMPSSVAEALWDRSLLLPTLAKYNKPFWEALPTSEEGYGKQFSKLEYDETYRPVLPQGEADSTTRDTKGVSARKRGEVKLWPSFEFVRKYQKATRAFLQEHFGKSNDKFVATK